MTIIAGFGYLLLEDYLKRDEVKIIQSYDESKSGKDSTIEKPIPTTTPKDENSILKKAEVIVYKLKGIKRKAGTNIAGCLIAFAAEIAIKRGYYGFVSLESKTLLIDHTSSKQN